MKKELKGQLNAQEVADLKAKQAIAGKQLYEVSAEGHIAYLTTPSRQILGAARLMADGDQMKFNEIVLENCMVAGSEEFKSSDKLFLGLVPYLSDIVEVAEVRIKKL
ncbi:MAG: hypothetical protein K2Q03_03520 [Sphingobacteriaceae bacterium]|nr:hypothetical protein [Sphingobacteriaceae bacterium]